MMRDISLCWERPELEGRVAVEVSTGVREESLDDGELRYTPTPDWRAISADEREALRGTTTGSRADAVRIFETEPSLGDEFWRDVAPVACFADSCSPEERAARLWRFGRRLAAALGLAADAPLRSCDVQVTPANSASTGYDYERRRFVGLHIDNHDKLPLGARGGAFRLACLNVGPAVRYLHFVNLGVPRLLAAVGGDDAATDARFRPIRRLTSEFFRAHPDYPVVRISLPPNTGYVAVTQYLIHDGATNSEGRPDVAFLLGGDLDAPSR